MISGLISRQATFLLWFLLAGLTAQATAQIQPLPSLKSIDGSRYDRGVLRDSRVVVLCWNSLGCPMSKVYTPRLVSLAKKFRDQPVQFFLINSNLQDGLAAIREHAQSHRLGFPVVRDEGGRLARYFGVTRTTEVVALDRLRNVAYRGAVDDQYGYRKGNGKGNVTEAGMGVGTYRKDAPGKHYLQDAIWSLLRGNKVAVPKTDPMGCALGLPPRPKPGDRAAADTVTFHGRIQTILQKHCQRCHHDGGAAPFALETYRQARGWADMIAEVVAERRMPPWGANPRIGKFRNDPRLSAADIAAIQAWVEGGAWRGDVASAPKPIEWPTGWQIGKPDVIYTAGKFLVPAEGRQPYRYVRIKTDFEEDRWVQAAQVRSTSPDVVHHVLILLRDRDRRRAKGRPYTPPFHWTQLFGDVPRKERMRHIRRNEKYLKDMLQAGGGIHGYFLAELPGGPPIVYPQHHARLLPAGATLICQIHYTPNGKATETETRLALRFAKAPPEHARSVHAQASVTFEIPPGAPNHRVQTTFRFARGARLLSLLPHMHLRGKSVRYTLVQPDGRRETLLEVPRYDFDWQQEYVLEQPLQIMKGARLIADAVYDNSARNPYNPDPTKTIYFGLQSEDEMMIPYFEVIWDR